MMKDDGMTWNSIQQKIILQAFAWLGESSRFALLVGEGGGLGTCTRHVKEEYCASRLESFGQVIPSYTVLRLGSAKHH